VCQRHLKLSEFSGGYLVLEKNQVTCHVEGLLTARAGQPNDFAVRDQTLEVAHLPIDREGTAGDERGVIQWLVKNHSLPRAEVVGAYGDSDERTLGRRGGNLHACECVGNLGLRRGRRCEDGKRGADRHCDVRSAEPTHWKASSSRRDFRFGGRNWHPYTPGTSGSLRNNRSLVGLPI
jgi:hypothetical protein